MPFVLCFFCRALQKAFSHNLYHSLNLLSLHGRHSLSLRKKSMEANSASKLCFLCIILICRVQFAQCSVTYDRKSLIINEEKRVFFSGSIHYPRKPPQVPQLSHNFRENLSPLWKFSWQKTNLLIKSMWVRLIQKAKVGGLDVIDTCVFWNLHECILFSYNSTSFCLCFFLCFLVF